MDITEAAKLLKLFQVDGLTRRLSVLEREFPKQAASGLTSLCTTHSITEELLAAAFEFKAVAGQVNVLIHAIGILLSLPYLLEPQERVEQLSLGAGNTGRAFDLVTTHQIAEFKFINWRGGAETIRQNALFKDFYGLAEEETSKEKRLYLLDVEHPLAFLNGTRALGSVLSRNVKLKDQFYGRYGETCKVVRDYYLLRKDRVQIVDITERVPKLKKYVGTVTEVNES